MRSIAEFRDKFKSVPWLHISAEPDITNHYAGAEREGAIRSKSNNGVYAFMTLLY